MAVNKRKASKRKVSKRKYQNAGSGSNAQGGNANAQGGNASSNNNMSGIVVGDDNEQNNASEGSTINKGNRSSGNNRGRGRGRGRTNPPSLIDRIKKKGNEFLDFIGFEDGGTSPFANPMDQHGHGVQRSRKKRKK